MARGWVQISVKEELYSKLQSLYELSKRPDSLKFSAYVNELLRRVVEYENLHKQYGTIIDYLGAKDNRISLYDNMGKKTITVYVDTEKQKLVCDADDSSDCVHIGFCLGTPETYAFLVDRGFIASKDPSDSQAQP